jgi:archaellum biogenesis protein FlaJ (TadC family)
MNKPSSLIWMVFILLIILPTPAGKFIIDLAGGIFIFITITPLILGGIGWFAWKRIQSKIQTCEACGTTFLNSQMNCPVCGTTINNKTDFIDNIPASAATIDIKSEDIDL